jgi:energy-coupling factor transporter ATP-binding protein EcfA2
VVYDKFDLDIARGELISVFGHNGSGKSTLINMIAGLITPDAGEVCCSPACPLMWHRADDFRGAASPTAFLEYNGRSTELCGCSGSDPERKRGSWRDIHVPESASCATP